EGRLDGIPAKHVRGRSDPGGLEPVRTGTSDRASLRTTMPGDSCPHISAVKTVKHAAARQCEECVKTDSQWVHLRTCQTFGVTLCCESSPHKHATKTHP